MRKTSRALLVAGLAAGVAALAGCAHPSAPADPPASTPTASASPSPAPRLGDGPAVGTAGTGSDGLTVRYLGPDGKIKTLPAEDFPR